MLEEAEEDVLAFYAFPTDHWRKLRDSPRAPARPEQHARGLNREIGRRTDVGIFPDDRSLVRLATMLCIEQNDEWRDLKTRSTKSSKLPEKPTAPPTS